MKKLEAVREECQKAGKPFEVLLVSQDNEKKARASLFRLDYCLDARQRTGFR